MVVTTSVLCKFARAGVLCACMCLSVFSRAITCTFLHKFQNNLAKLLFFFRRVEGQGHS